MDNLRTIATFLRKQLADIELEMKKLADIELEMKKLEGMSMDEMRQKAAVYSPVDNIIEILNDCYSSFLDDDDDGKIEAIIGKMKSRKWQEFQLKVISKLLRPGHITDDFNDTANGCDEVVWDAGLEMINELTAT